MKKTGCMSLLVMFLLLTACVDNDRPNNGYLCKYLLLNLYNQEGDYLIEVTDSGVMTISSGHLNDDFYDRDCRLILSVVDA